MSEVLPTAEGRLSISLDPQEADAFREMLRQQLLGDQELLRDCIAGREDPEVRLEVYDRLQALRPMADALGVPENPERRRPRRPTTISTRRLPEYITPSGPVFALIAMVTVGFQAIVVLTGNDLGFGFFYPPIISATSLRYGRRAGFIAAAIATVMISLVAHVALRGAHEMMALGTTGVALAAFALLAWVTARERLVSWL